MFETAARTIKTHNMLDRGDRVIVALSGGPDSMALLFFLCQIRQSCALDVFALHVNHRIRGEEAERDALFVAGQCEKMGVALYLCEKDVPLLSSKNKISIEEAGRQVRYEAFRLALEHFGADKIATGHNKNDAAETFLLNLSRGAGAHGLCGIAPTADSTGICVIRPLIGCGREQIERYAEQNNIPFITDSTNSEPLYTRNKIRLELLPWLENNINSDIINTITATAGLLKEQSEFLDSLAKSALLECAANEGGNTLSLKLNELDKNHIALKRMILREALRKVSGSLTNISAAHIADILSLCGKQTGKRISLPSGMVCEVRYGFLDIFIEEQAETPSFCYKLPINVPVYVKEKNVYALLSDKRLVRKNKNLCTKMYKCDKILFETHFRTRLPGDRIKLPGGTKKLGDYFTDKKIPKAQRNSAELIADGKDILSILGMCDSELVKHGKNEFFIHFWED